MSCPDESVLSALAAGKLELVPSELEVHIDTCVPCQAAVVAAAVAAAVVEPGTNGNELRDQGVGAQRLVTEAQGRYEILGECGRGGQSRVFRVFDHRLDREVALKQLEAQGELPLRRFLREVRIMGELAHPAVVPVHDVGVRESGAPYYTMPLVSGRTLATVVAEASDLGARLRLLPQFVQVCHAVGAAHERGILHRDVKPQNIMLGPFGRALLLDWGLAKFRRSVTVTGAWELHDEPRGGSHEHEFTRPGTTMGTPAYMSPEQAVGDPEAIDGRSDVWSLGAVLFYLLSACPPFGGSSMTETIAAVSSGERRDLWALEPGLEPELVAIVERAMHRDLRERYPTAAHLADDLIAYQNGRRVYAYDYSRWERLQRFARRYWAALAAVTTVFATLAITLVVVTRSYRREAEQRQRAERAQVDAENQRERAEHASAFSHTQSRWAMSHLARAHAEKAERLRDDHELLRARVYAASSFLYNPTNVRSPYYEPSAAAWMTDGREVLARATALLLQSDNDAVIGSLGDVPRTEPLEPRELRLAVTPERSIYAVADGREQVEVRSFKGDVEVGMVRLPGHQGGAEVVDVSRTGRFAVTRDASDDFRLWTLPEGDLRAMWSNPTAPMSRLAVSDGGAVASIDAKQRVVVRDPDSGVLRLVSAEPSPAFALSFSADGRELVVGENSGWTEVFDVEHGRVTGRCKTHEQWVSAVTMSADGALVAAGGANGLISLCRAGAAEPVTQFSGHRGSILSLRFSDDGTRLFSTASDGKVRGYDLELDDLLFDLEAPGVPAYDIGLRGTELMALSGNGLRRWSLRPSPRRWRKSTELQNMRGSLDGHDLVLPSIARSELAFLDTDDGSVETLALPGAAVPWSVSARGRRVVTSHLDGQVIWWDHVDGQLTMQTSRAAGTAQPLGVAVHPSGSLVTIDAGDGAFAIVSRDPNARTLRRDGHERRVTSMAFSPRGDVLVTASYDGAVVLWETADWTRLTTLREGPGIADAVTFAGPELLLAAGEFGVETWTLHDGEWSFAMQLSPTPHRSVVAGPKGGHVAGASYEGHAKVWTIPDGKLVLDVRRYRMVQGIAFDADERNLWLIGYRAFEPLSLDRSRFDGDAETLLREAEDAAHMTLTGEAR